MRRTTTLFISLLVTGFFLAGCATTGPENGPQNVERVTADGLKAFKRFIPDWALKESTRESSVTETSTIKLGDEHTLEIIGKLLDEPVYQEEGDLWYFAIDYSGEEGYLDCYILSNRGEPIHALEDSHKYALQDWLPEESSVDRTIPTLVQVKTDARLPIVALDYIYYVDADSENTTIARSTGEAAYQRSHVLVCTDDVFGYRDTFRRIFHHMVETWDVKNERLVPYYHETAQVSLNNTPAGFIVVDFYKDDKGDTRAVSVNSTLLRRDALSVSMDEGSDISWSTPEGNLLSVYHSHTENSQLDASLQLRRNKTNNWIASGKYKDKDVEFNLGADATPISSLGQYQVMRDMVTTNETDPQTFLYWEPAADPSSFLDAIVALKSNSSNMHSGTLDIGPLKMNITVDETGSVPEGILKMGGIEMRINRVRKTGSFE